MNKIKTYYYHYDGMFEGDKFLSDDLYVQLKDFEQLQKENESLQDRVYHATRRVEELEQEIRHIQNDVVMNLENENELLKRKIEIAKTNLQIIAFQGQLNRVHCSVVAQGTMEEIEAMNG